MPSNLQPILFLVAIAVVFYLLMIRPQQKKRKEMQSMLQSLKPGSEIVTTAGMYGKVVALEGDDALLIEVAPGVTCKYMRQAIMRVVPDAAPAVTEPETIAAADDKAESAATTDGAVDGVKDDAKDSAAEDAAADEPTSTVSKDGANDSADSAADEAADSASDGADTDAAESKDESGATNGDRRTSS